MRPIKSLTIVMSALASVLLNGCGATPPAQANNNPSGNQMVRVISDSTLLIDKDATNGEATAYIENKSDKTIHSLNIVSSAPDIVSIGSENCGDNLAAGARCEVKYTGRLNADKYQDSASILATFSSDNTQYTSDGVIDILRNTDSDKIGFSIVNQRLVRNLDGELVIHANGRLNNYQIQTVKVNGQDIKVNEDGQDAKLKGGDNLTVLIPADVVNATNPFDSELNLAIDATANNKPLMVQQNFIVGVSATGAIYQPTSSLLNPTYSFSFAQTGQTIQPVQVNYLESFPAGFVTDNIDHTFNASLVISPSVPTAMQAICANVVSFTQNTCSVTISGSGGTSLPGSNTCSESVVINYAAWPSSGYQAISCAYQPQIQDQNGMPTQYPTNGVLTLNISKTQIPNKVALQADSVQTVATLGTPTGSLPIYGNSSTMSFSLSGTNPPASYRYFKITSYESNPVTVSYDSTNWYTNNATLLESPTMVTTLISPTAKACNGSYILTGVNDSCYVVLQLTASGTTGLAKDVISFSPTITNTATGVINTLSAMAYLQYSTSFSSLGTMRTVMGGPNGVIYTESMLEREFLTESKNGSNNGGSTVGECGTTSNNNTYQCIVQGSYLNVKLPLTNNTLPSNFTYQLANQAALTAQGFTITYALADTANPQIAATTSTTGCTIPAYSSATTACYINIQNTWSTSNTASGNIALNVIGYYNAAPSIVISNNWINFYAINPTSKVLSMYNTPSGDNINGSDAYWMSGESWGLTWNESTPEVSQFVNGGGRFFNYAATGTTGDTNCLVDRVTGILWYLTNPTAGITPTNSMLTPGTITCNSTIVATPSGIGGQFTNKTRIPSEREFISILDYRYNSTDMINLGGKINATSINNQYGLLTSNYVAHNPNNPILSPPPLSVNNVWPLAIVDLKSAATSINWGFNNYTLSNSGLEISAKFSGSSKWLNTPNSNLAAMTIVSIPTSVLTPKVTLLKTQESTVTIGDAGYQESSPGYTSTGSVGLAWPTGGKGTVANADGGGLVPSSRFGDGRYVNDPTNNCLIDQATGLIYQKVYTESPTTNYSGNSLNTDYSDSISNFDKSGGSRYGLCGLKNWRIINAREFEAAYNYQYQAYQDNGGPDGGTYVNSNWLLGWLSWGNTVNKGSIFMSLDGATNTIFNYVPLFSTYTIYANSGNANRLSASSSLNNGATSADAVSYWFFFAPDKFSGVPAQAQSNIFVAGGAARIQP